MVNDNDKILIDRYLRQELTKDEMLALESRLAQEKELAQYASEMKVLRSAMRANALKEKMALLKSIPLPDDAEIENDKSENDKSENDESKKASNSKWWLWLILAMLAAAVITYSQLGKDSTRKPSVQYAHMFGDDFTSQYVKHKVMRSSDLGDLSPEQSRAFALYTAKMFDEAIPYLKELWEEEQDSLALYYLGVSYLGIGEDEKGEEILEMDF